MTTREEADKALGELLGVAYVEGYLTGSEARVTELADIVRARLAELEAENAALKGEQDADAGLQEWLVWIRDSGFSPEIQKNLVSTALSGWNLKRLLRRK